jgi:hypothetical protein
MFFCIHIFIQKDKADIANNPYLMSDRDLKFVYLFCQTDTFLFVIETRKCKHSSSRNQHLQNVEH